ncbi:FHIP family protein AGAP011705 isoform X2 [Macrosteles quadrilineatus]|uniref:FHIP family protein AGAP011705 isoform X2 n=1 Tax=Macrosteles quadrilineatus TaxID=74068 RepID=UPI0023E26985|nr:FHIP family protein AGAP011705 isoform X2 [Macrosteles quadrilineatus]
MSWLKNSNFGTSIGKLKGTSPPKECDPSAIYESFKKHWQQTNDIIEKTEPLKNPPKTDDILGVVNHLDHMVTLLVIEMRSSYETNPCLEFLLSENLLDKLFQWSTQTGRYGNALKLEQIRLYEALISHSQVQLLIHESFHRPLQALLASCVSQLFSVEIEKRLVVLLNQLCVLLVQHNQLLSLFFHEPSEGQPSRFTIFSLLIHFVHRDGALGQQARDALLLCMVLSKTNPPIAEFIAHQSTVCPVLATGLSGLYSALPRKLAISTEDWYRFTPDDVNEIPELVAFMNNLEFCNAVVQVADSSVRNQLLEYIYQGFLVPVMGPALLQETADDGGGGSLSLSPLQLSTEEELTTATAYLDLFLRSLSAPGLLHSFVCFILRKTYDGQRIIDSLVQRIKSTSRLCLVTLALLETLVDLNCEDVMLELVFRHLVPCSHIMLSQRSRIRHVDSYCTNADKLLSLTPDVNGLHRPELSEGSLYGDYQAYLHDARSKILSCSAATNCWMYPYDGENPPHTGFPVRPVDLPVTLDAEADHSLPSADDGSSGYESFALKEGGRGSESGGDCDSPCGSDHDSPSKSQPSPTLYDTGINTVRTIGPFLDAVLQKLEAMLSQDLYTNLRLTGLISRLAVYPQPLLHSLLLDHSLVFQPGIPYLFQVLCSLKSKIERLLVGVRTVEGMVKEAQQYLLEREDRLVNARKHALEAPASLPPTTFSPADPFDRGDSKRRSLTMALSSVFRRNGTPPVKDPRFSTFQNYRYLQQADSGVRDTVMCAVVLDEWLKELAAISQEHTIIKLSS